MQDVKREHVDFLRVFFLISIPQFILIDIRPRYTRIYSKYRKSSSSERDVGYSHCVWSFPISIKSIVSEVIILGFETIKTDRYDVHSVYRPETEYSTD